MRGSFDEDERRDLVADELIRLKADPLLCKAVVSPDAEDPPATFLDAKEMYRKERMNGATGRNQLNRLERVTAAWGRWRCPCPGRSMWRGVQ